MIKSFDCLHYVCINSLIRQEDLTLNFFSFAEVDQYAYLRQSIVREPRGFERMKLFFSVIGSHNSLEAGICMSSGLF